MNKSFILLLILAALLISHHPLQAQTLQWEWKDQPINHNLGPSFLHAANATTVFIGSTDLFISSNRGDSWIKAVDSGLTLDCLCHCILKGNTLFAAGYYHQGIYRSTNDGISWGKVDPSIIGLNGTLAANETSIFIVTNGNVYRSTDEGDVWARADNGIPNNAYIAQIVLSGTTIFAVSESLPSNPYWHVYRSTDNGDSWIEADSGLPDNTINLAISKNLILATIGSSASVVYRSIDNGTTWISGGGGLSDTYVGELVENETTIFGSTDSGVFLSTNGGKKWANGGLNTRHIYKLVIGDRTLFADTDSGLFRADISQFQNAVPANLILQSASLLIVSPNPARDELQISYNFSGEKSEISLFNIFGKRLIFSSCDRSGKMKMNISSLPDGMYEIVLRSEEMKVRREVMIVR